MLTKMALNIYAIPPMSSEPERIFSGSKHTISDERGSLKPDTIEALEICKCLMRIGVFTNTDITAALHSEMEDLEDLKDL